MFLPDARARGGVSVALAANAVLMALIANWLIGMDSDPMMPCRLKTLPALNVISALAFALAICNAISLLRGAPPRDAAKGVDGAARPRRVAE
jgi:hypothetical protein